MQRREFIKGGLLAAVAAAFPELFAAELSELESGLVRELLAKLGEVNPLDPKTGARKFISFGFLTDVHKCHRVEGDDVENFGACRKDYYYWGALTDAAPTVRTLGAVAREGGLDGIFFGGDFSTGNSTVPLTDQEYVDEIMLVREMFANHFGKVPFFAVDGNHDRCYKTQHVMDDATWAKVQKSFNSDVSKNDAVDLVMERDLAHPTMGRKDAEAKYEGSSYYVDFTRLLKTGGRNVRLACTSHYDRGPGCSPVLRYYDALQFYDPVTKKLLDERKTPENTLVGFIAHDAFRPTEMLAPLYMNAGSRFGSSTAHAQFNCNLGQHRGLGFIGNVAGHLHQSLVKPVKGIAASSIQVAQAFSEARNSKRGKGFVTPPGAFSVFTVDTEAKLLHETRLFGGKVDNRSTQIAQN